MTVLQNDKKDMIPSKSSEWLENYHTELEWDASPPKLNTSDIDMAMEKMFSYHDDYDDDDDDDDDDQINVDDNNSKDDNDEQKP